MVQILLDYVAGCLQDHPQISGFQGDERVLENSCSVDDSVDWTEAPLRACDYKAHLLFIGDVCLRQQYFAASASNPPYPRYKSIAVWCHCETISVLTTGNFSASGQN